MARALIVGCGCRGRELGRLLAAAGWAVRGTSRAAAASGGIEAAGIEAAVADPDRPATVLEHVGDVTLVFWLMGSAEGETEVIAAVHGPRLERILEKLVDSPVRGFVYEAGGGVQHHLLQGGASIVRAAADKWRIPVEVVDVEPSDWKSWAEAMLRAVERLVGTRAG